MANQKPSDSNNIKRLYLSDKDKQLAGVCGGIAEYLQTDPTMIRLLWIIVTVITGIVPGIIAYIIAAIVIPSRPEGDGGKINP